MFNMYFCLHVKYPLFMFDINGTWIFLDRVSKSTQASNFMKMLAVGAEWFRAFGRAFRHDEINSRFSQLCERTQQCDTSSPPISMLHTCTTLAHFSVSSRITIVILVNVQLLRNRNWIKEFLPDLSVLFRPVLFSLPNSIREETQFLPAPSSHHSLLFLSSFLPSYISLN